MRHYAPLLERITNHFDATLGWAAHWSSGNRLTGNPMDTAKYMRERAVRLLAMALEAREIDQDYADKLVAEAVELQDQATAIEEVAEKNNK